MTAAGNDGANGEEPTPEEDDLQEVTAPQQETWTAERLMRASYKDIGTPTQVQDRFLAFLLKSRVTRDALKNLYTSASSSNTRDYSLEIDTFELIHHDTVLGCLVLRYPATLLPLLEKAIVHAQTQLFEVQPEDDAQIVPTTGTVKGDTSVSMTRVHARLVHLPPTCTKSSLNHMEANDVGKIWQVQGTVVRAAQVQMYESARTYKCSGKHGCGRTFAIEADLEQCHNALVKPDVCPLTTPERGEPCKGTNLEVVGSMHTDYQEIKIQEAASRIGMGHIPRSLKIKLQHDLVDTCQPGDEVVIVGSLLAQWPQSTIQDVDCPIGMALKAHSIRVVQEKGGSVWNDDDIGELDRMKKEFDAYWNDEERQRNPIAARDFVVKAVCPQLYGLAMIKLALLVTLIGGVPSSSYHQEDENDGKTANLEDNTDEPDQFRIHQPNRNAAGTRSQSDFYHDGGGNNSAPKKAAPKERSVKTRRRDQSHMLLVGDPGTAKSQVLRFAAALCPRSVLTTGVGTTSAGLTCAAVREGSGSEFVLEAGALVLADKGVCCIDEFGCIRKEDRTTIHEAMEQQTLSVAKGGIVCKLNCRATILAVMNPKDALYDNHTSLSRNTGLGTPLLSRFDIIFKMVDTSDASRDCNITTYLLNRAITGDGFQSSVNANGTAEDQPWSMDKLRAYISIVKDRFNPALGEDAATLLERHYEKCRSADSTTIPVTVRFLESMIRLSQAHARLMYRSAVKLEDAVAVLRIMECSAFAYGGFDGVNVDDVHNVLYRDPMTMEFNNATADLEFLAFEHAILERYGMIDRMNPNDRRKALEYMNGGVDGENNEHSGWGNVAGGGGGGNSPWQSYTQHHLQPAAAVQEDHYGRYQFPTQPAGGRPGGHGSDEQALGSKRARTGY
jgi:DNA helicase MCM9